MELGDYFQVLWRWLWLIVLGVAVAGVSTCLAVRDQPAMYQARARLMVGQVLQEQQPKQADFWLAENLAQSYREIANGRPIREAAQEALGLAWLPAYTVEQVPNTQLLDIQVTDTDPQRAAAVANEVANQLILHSPTNPGPEEAQRREFVRQELDDLETDIEATKAEIARLQDALGGMFGAREIADTQNQIATLQQKLNNLQLNYGQLLTFMGQGVVNSLSVVEPAVAPPDPVGSGMTRTVVMAATVGLVLALGTAFLLEYLDDTIKTPADVEKAMRLTTLAGVSRIPGERLGEMLITVRHPKSPVSEAYRVLRTNLQFSSLDRPLKTLVVTSPNPTEGKSTTVANLGVVMAQAGKRVIVVDADLRRPVLHRVFQVDNNRGLTDMLLSDELVLDGHLQRTNVDNLRLLNTGPLPPNPSELLGSQRMAALIARLREEADVILFDSPPSLAVTDASVLASQADGVLMVADAGRTRRNLAQESVDRLRQVGANLLGVVLNRRKPGRGEHDYSYYYGNGRRRHAGRWRWLPRRSKSA